MNLYFCALELATNAAKHSGGNSGIVTIEPVGSGQVRISVTDDGTGGASVGTHREGGLAGAADRVAALEGELTIDSPPGGPTTIDVIAPTTLEETS
ncbi:sensor histidine kinase [Kytococcus sedentarius]|uniref:sensor histidine kinase n=1 Tax=Kytococcus sedentarius TaxID=1276 RepID=UPI00384D3544